MASHQYACKERWRSRGGGGEIGDVVVRGGAGRGGMTVSYIVHNLGTSIYLSRRVAQKRNCGAREENSHGEIIIIIISKWKHKKIKRIIRYVKVRDITRGSYTRELYGGNKNNDNVLSRGFNIVCYWVLPTTLLGVYYRELSSVGSVHTRNPMTFNRLLITA